MSRLPIPGSDDGSWGDVLNNFLAVAHNNDGTLVQSATLANTAQLAAGAAQSVNTVTPVNGVLALAASDLQLLNTTAADTRFLRTANGVRPDGNGNLEVTPIITPQDVIVQNAPSLGQVIQWDGANWQAVNPPQSATPTTETMSALIRSGELIVGNNILKPGIIPTGPTTLVSGELNLSTAPTGSGVLVAVTQGAATLATLQVAAGVASSGLEVGFNTAVQAYIPIQFHVYSVGTTFAGSDATVTLNFDSSITGGTGPFFVEDWSEAGPNPNIWSLIASNIAADGGSIATNSSSYVVSSGANNTTSLTLQLNNPMVMLASNDYDVMFDINWNRVPNGVSLHNGQQPPASVVLNTSVGVEDGDGYDVALRLTVRGDGGATIGHNTYNNPHNYDGDGSVTGTFMPGSHIVVRFQHVLSTPMLRYKLWYYGSNEPATWTETISGNGAVYGAGNSPVGPGPGNIQFYVGLNPAWTVAIGPVQFLSPET